MSSDPELAFFSSGLTQDVVTDLSRWQSMSVASLGPGSAHGDARTAGRELGVNFLADGSVRQMGENVRITVQLIDAQTGDHIWAERYDCPRADLNAAQDGLVRKIAGTFVGRIYETVAERIRRSRPPSQPAYDLTMRGNWLAWDRLETRIEAKRCLEQAIELDPEYGLASSLLAFLLRADWHFGLAGSADVLDRAFALAKQGIAHAEFEATSYVAMGFCHLDRRSFEQALSHLTRAVEINPANPAIKADLGLLLARIGRAAEGLEQMRDAQRTDSFFAPSWYWPMRAAAQFSLRRYGDALDDFDRGGALAGADSIAMMAGCCAQLGLVERSRELTALCLARQPEATIGEFVQRIVYSDARDSAHLAECLRLAGLPE
jgi:adenylate cyclase